MSTKNLFFLFLILIGFTLSILNNFYQIEYFDYFRINENGIKIHSMINSDIFHFWREGALISESLIEGKNYFLTGEEYRRPYLPSRIYAFFSILMSQDLLTNEGLVSLEFNKILILISQTIIFYLLIICLYFVLINHLPKNVSKIIIIFLAFEPTLFMYHSSFLSESFFFSLQILLLIFILFRNHSNFSIFLIGLILGILYLQRSVAIFYIIPILIYFYSLNKKNFIRYALIMLVSLSLVHTFVGYHNFKRIGFFYNVSTQAKDGFYDYLLPIIISEKNKINISDAQIYIEDKKKIWMKKNNLENKSFEDELNRMKYYDYAKNYSSNVMIKNPLLTSKIILKKTLHFFIIDPLTHVYYFHRWDNLEGLFYGSDTQKKWVVPRIIYSLIVYFFVFLGFYNFFKNEKNNKLFFLIITSILYFTAVQSWYGGTRYFAPILIYLSFPFAFGLISFKKLFKII
jgi:hypothetical protein